MREPRREIVAGLPRLRAWLALGRLRQARGGGATWLLQLPALLLVGVFVVLPVLVALYLSFRVDGRFGLDNYRAFVRMPQYPLALWNTFVFSALSSLATVALVFPACLYAAHNRGLVFRLFLAALSVALAISGLIRTVSWQLILSRSGLLDAAARWLGLADAPLDLLYSKAAVFIGMTQIMMPIAAMTLLNGLRTLDHELAAVAGSLGAGPLRRLRDVYWPQMRRPLANALLLVFTLTTGLFLIPVLLGGPQDTVLGKLILSDMTYDFQDGAGRAAVSGVATMLLVLAASALCLLLAGRPFQRRARR